ncbi:MAG: type III-B CRISPR module-associated protein Cmr3 [Aquificaceae bacterium]|nr:type III-B CRISPR module-associated protein Cmr3 [Aquificaceae bacterium]
MSWRDFTIEAVDVWLFRDGRPFSAGSDVWARSLPMPSPFTLLGALRTFFLTQKGISPRDFYEGKVEDQKLKEQWGGPGAHPGQLRLRGAFWYKGGHIYFSAPADLVRVQGKLQLLQPLRQDSNRLQVKLNFPLDELSCLWAKSSKPVEPVSGYISDKDLRSYLGRGNQSDSSDSEGELENISLLPLQEFLEKERRTGIKIGAGRSVEEGFLYHTEFIRLKEGVRLCGSAYLPNGIERAEGILFLGGERRMGVLRWETPSHSLEELLESFKNKPATTQERVKIVLLSPAYFSEGWKPKSWSDIGLNGWTLVAAAVPRLVPIGMFEKKGDRIGQKRFYCVPPGSVYFFERKQGSAEFPPAFTQEPPTREGEDSRLPLGQLGFGLYATSTWNYA